MSGATSVTCSRGALSAGSVGGPLGNGLVLGLALGLALGLLGSGSGTTTGSWSAVTVPGVAAPSRSEVASVAPAAGAAKWIDGSGVAEAEIAEARV